MYLLSLTEMCQRFAFWGVGFLLVLYLTKVHAWAPKEATNLYGIFTGCAFVLPLLGGYLADRLGHKWTVLFGSIATAIGCFLMATQNLDYLTPALALIAIGGGAFTPGIYSLLGHIYRGKNSLRQSGFSIYYAAVNIGVFLAMIILGYVEHKDHWALAFRLAGIGQIIGLIPFYYSLKNPELKNLMPEKRKSVSGMKLTLTKQEKDRIIVILTLSFFSIFYWIAYSQGGSSLELFGKNFTNRQLGSFTIPTAWLFSVESLCLVLFAFPMAAFYRFLQKTNKDPSASKKTAISLLTLTVSFFIIMIGAKTMPPTGMNPLFPIMSYIIMAISEMLLAPIGLSLVTNLSPKRYTGLLIGVWYLCVGIAFYLGGRMGGLIKAMGPASFLGLFVLASLVAGIVLFGLSAKLTKMEHAGTLES